MNLDDLVPVRPIGNLSRRQVIRMASILGQLDPDDAREFVTWHKARVAENLRATRAGRMKRVPRPPCVITLLKDLEQWRTETGRN